MGIGGLPRGRVVHLYAETTVGKSTFTQWLCGVTQKQGGNCFWGDAERTILKAYASGSGMDLDKVWIPEWSTGSDLLYKTKQAIALGVFDIIVIDSLDAVRPQRDADKLDPSMHDNLAHARLLNGFFYDIQGGYTISDAHEKKIENYYTVPWYNPKGKLEHRKDIHVLGHKRTVLIIISHKKVKIETGFAARFGGPKTRTSGGGEKDFAATCQLDLIHVGFKKGKKKKDSKKSGILRWREVKVRADKNKVAKPLGETIIKMMPDGWIIPDDDDIYDIEAMSVQEATKAGLAAPKPEVDDFRARLEAFKKGDNNDGLPEQEVKDETGGEGLQESGEGGTE